MSTLMSWLFHRGRTGADSGEVTRASNPLFEQDEGHEQSTASLTAEDGTGAGQTQALGDPMFVRFEAPAQRLSALLEGLTPIYWKAALVTFVGTGITEPSRYEDAAAAFNQLRLMAPPHEGALVQVFRHQLREESEGDDFLYLHFAGDPLSFGFLMCALTGGGLMAGWRVN
jgi:hypothetical protein